MKENNIICTEDFNLEVILGKELEISNWKIDGLPADSFSINNALILKYSTRWPLLIDPQGQANNWIATKIKRQTTKNYSILRLT